MKKIKILIILLCVFIIIIFAALFLYKNTNNNSNEDYIYDKEDNTYKELAKNKALSAVNYYAVIDDINSLLDSTLKNNEKYYSRVDNAFITDGIDFNTMIYNQLSTNYIEANKITKENVLNFIPLTETKEEFIPINIKIINSEDDIKTYKAKGIIRKADYNGNLIEIAYYIVRISSKNSTYSIEPINKNEYENEYNVNGEKEIPKNGNNMSIQRTISAQTDPEEYFNMYKKLMITYPKAVYDMMSEEYRNKRYGSYENFEKYAKNNVDEIRGLSFEEYFVNTENGYTQYVSKDQYGNLYIFNQYEYSHSNLEIQLDTYTLENSTFKNKYNSSDTSYKVAMNIDKWIQMLNCRDYYTAFNVLDETFRTTYFNNDVDIFEKYMRAQLPEHYTIEFEEYSEKGKTSEQKIYLNTITEKDSENNEEGIEKTIFMQLKDDYNFVMSFNVD